MTIKTVTHLNFRGDARGALEFYQSVFGGELTVVTHAQSYGTTDPKEADLVGYGSVFSEDGFAIMAFDVPAARPYNPGESALFVSVRGPKSEEITAYWDRLKVGGEVIVDLAPAGWVALYGMLKDKFGITWVLDVLA
ncbi:PhnB protein [Devosia sp. YR412]|uniref:VOC family protein n=1 Tax=Devosia sp. YR412 TaxID=1881030 RepID=UPI0008B724DE|nr:VOC family protein [Devosia sp. YR412]SEQ10276.1 PhnB protein [Devosia sp. YR412]